MPATIGTAPILRYKTALQPPARRNCTARPGTLQKHSGFQSSQIRGSKSAIKKSKIRAIQFNRKYDLRHLS